jgi:hypothetical protein
MANIKHLTKYWKELQTLDLSGDLEKYNQKTGKYETKINTLQQKALLELALLKPNELVGQQAIFRDLETRIKKFWGWYFEMHSVFREGKLLDVDFWPILKGYFLTSGKPNININLKLLHNLHDAVMFKNGSLKVLITKTDLFNNIIKVETEQIEPLDIQKATHKILILHELGILDHLKKNYSVFTIDTNTNISKLLAPLLNEKPETIRKAIENLHQGKPKSIINTASVRKVKAELSKLGIETQTLPDL